MLKGLLNVQLQRVECYNHIVLPLVYQDQLKLNNVHKDYKCIFFLRAELLFKCTPHSLYMFFFI